MKALIRTGALALALLLAGCGEGGGDQAAPIAAPTPAIPAPDGGEWTKIVVETPEGGFRMGNPDAPVKLVEYASVTCPHCAKFSRQATGPLTQLVKSGHLSWEFRHYLLFPTDPAVSLLARCGGPRDFFALTERLYASQSDWSDKVQALPSAELERIRALPPAQQAGALVKGAGLDELLRERGVPQAQIDRCLAGGQEVRKLEALTLLGRREGVPGTPAFFINGRFVKGVGNWAALRPPLQSALSR
jgi:protein-disulfide isomerase